MKRFIFRYDKEYPKGFVMGLRLHNWSIAIWLGYGKPIWWKPRFIGSGRTEYGFGFGWLFWCLRWSMRKKG